MLEKVDGGFQVSLKFLFVDNGERREGDQWVEDPNLRFQVPRPIRKENRVIFWGICRRWKSCSENTMSGRKVVWSPQSIVNRIAVR
jgi:hypothetical protein